MRTRWAAVLCWACGLVVTYAALVDTIGLYLMDVPLSPVDYLAIALPFVAARLFFAGWKLVVRPREGTRVATPVLWLLVFFVSPYLLAGGFWPVAAPLLLMSGAALVLVKHGGQASGEALGQH